MSEEEEVLAAAAQRVGTVLHGKYHIERVLGVGGMATVYAATHRNRKRFAIKMLHPEFSVRRDVRTRFVREGYVANSVNHPGVVVVLDDDVDETGAAFLVMELLEGVTVEALYTSAGAPLPLRESLCIAYQLLDVLEAAHEKSVVHRDIKPANIFILNDGQLKVVDFGIARLREADAGLKSTRTGAMLGTPAFMAPEQALAIPGDIDARTDIWAVGATLFTLLSAQFVHRGDNSRQIMIRAATEPARSLGSVAPDLPPVVIEVVTRALMFEKSARWPSARAMRDAVLEVHRGLFGEPSPSDLRALVERTSATTGSSPTELSPAIALGAPPSEGRVSKAAVRELAPSLQPASRALVTTTSTPVEGENSRKATGKARRARVALFATGAALAGTGLLLALTKRPHASAPTADSAGSPHAAPLAEATVPPARRTATGTRPEETAKPGATASPTSTSTPTSDVGERAPSSLTTLASSSASARTRPRTATSKSAIASAAVPAAAPPAPASNPLKLELQ